MPGLIENSLVGDEQAFEALGAAAEQAKNQYLLGLRQQAEAQQGLGRLIGSVGGLMESKVADALKPGKADQPQHASTPQGSATSEQPPSRDTAEPGHSSLLGSIFRRIRSGLTGSPQPQPQPPGEEQLYR
jgi:hypothetical protein